MLLHVSVCHTPSSGRAISISAQNPMFLQWLLAYKENNPVENTSTLSEDGVWHTETCRNNVVHIYYICDLVGIFEELKIYTISGQCDFSPEVTGRCCRVVRFLAEVGSAHKSTFSEHKSTLSNSKPHDVRNPCG